MPPVKSLRLPKQYWSKTRIVEQLKIYGFTDPRITDIDTSVLQRFFLEKVSKRPALYSVKNIRPSMNTLYQFEYENPGTEWDKRIRRHHIRYVKVSWDKCDPDGSIEPIDCFGIVRKRWVYTLHGKTTISDSCRVIETYDRAPMGCAFTFNQIRRKYHL